MHDDHGHDHPITDGNFEPSDAHVAPVLAIGIVLVLVTVASFVAGYILLKYSNERSAMTAFEPSPLVSDRQEWESGNVRLQVNLRGDLERHQAATKPGLTTYDVLSESPEIYRFPVELAIEHVADHGLPEFKPFGDGSLEGTAENTTP